MLTYVSLELSVNEMGAPNIRLAVGLPSYHARTIFRKLSEPYLGMSKLPTADLDL